VLALPAKWIRRIPKGEVIVSSAVVRTLAAARKKEKSGITFHDVGKTGPGTVAGQYLRLFWQPVCHATDVATKRTFPIRILGEDFTVYRSETGVPHVIEARCPHRSMPLHAGWVEGEEIRCYYHGWKFNAEGACTQQPAERPDFCNKISIKSYPTKEYLGLIFAYLGEGEPPEFARYPAFEADNALVMHDTYVRACNFFNNLENVGDLSHIAFAHGDASVAWDETKDGPVITATESCWGVSIRAVRPSGREIVGQFGMPNIFHGRGVPDDPEVPYREFLAWWVPVEDDRHIQFTVVVQPKDSEVTERYMKRRDERAQQRDLDPTRESVARELLAGTRRMEDIDPKRVNMIFLQDDFAQMGVGPIAERGNEHLGRGDIVLIMQRRLWVRELAKFAEGEPLTDWRYDASRLPIKSEFL